MTEPSTPLRILHVFRSPVGGLFRHVIDVARGQASRGHQVGIVCDDDTGGENAGKVLDEISASLALGLLRVPMGRQLGLGDYSATRHVARRVTETRPDVVHGHGAKGAAYARLAVSAGGPIRAVTPHGGSLLYNPGTAAGILYLTLEKLLKSRTDLFLFESAFIERLYRAKLGDPQTTCRTVSNGVGAEEFAEVRPEPQATDILYIGELRHLKGVDVLLESLAHLRAKGLSLTATIVGGGISGPDLQQLAQQLGLERAVRFLPPMPARRAFALGRIMVVPSRMESFPYIVLEVAAAGKPLIATAVGGIPDIFGPLSDRLIPADDCDALENAIAAAVNTPETINETARLLQERVRAKFSLDEMVDSGLAAYRAALAVRRR